MSAFLRRTLLSLVLVTAACGEESERVAAGAATPPPVTGIRFASVTGCRIDDDCAGGSFCFRNACVRECETDADCGEGAICSLRSRCVLADFVAPDDPMSDPALDESAVAEAPASLPAVEVVEWPPERVAVRTGEPFVTVTLRTAEAVPGGVLLYTVQNDEGSQTLRAQGETRFDLVIPTGKAGSDEPSASVVELTTPMGHRRLFLVPTLPVGGRYAGAFVPKVFGGAGLPLDLVVETVPPEVLSLEEADAAFVWLPASAESFVSLAAAGAAPVDFVRRPLTWDATAETWVATFGADLDSAAYFGSGVFPAAGRSVRIEIFGAEDGKLHGAVADRWYGLFERRTADGVVADGVANVSGYFTLHRVGGMPAGAKVGEGSGATPASAAARAPSLSACESAHFSFPATPVPEGEPPLPGPCGSITSAAQFAAADADERATCALAVARRALGGETITSMLQALLDPDQPNPGGMSFAAFIEACASETDPLCKPSSELLCARDLLAHAYRDADATGSTIGELAELYDEATKEAFVGRQLAAFHVDTQSRLQWLESSEAPAFLASTLLDYNQQILRNWQAQVLEAHLEGVFGQLDDAGLAVLGRATTDPVALARRKTLLLDLSNSWRAAMDALELLTERWNVLYQNDVQRAQAAASIRRTAFRLYASAAVIQELSRAVGSTYLVSEFGSGFSGLMRELTRLSLPFDDLIYARDAEVVVSRSVDPADDGKSLLAEAERAARRAVEVAAESVDLVLAEAQRTEIDETVLAAQFEDQLLSLRDELILLCGLPVGCEPSHVGNDPACAIPTAAGRCGFSFERGSSEVFLPVGGGDRASISEAGKALLALQESLLAVQEAQERLRAHAQITSLTGETVEAFAEKVESWNRQRRAVAAEIDSLLEEIDAFDSMRIDEALATLREQHALREAAYKEQEAQIADWSKVRLQGVEDDLRRLGAITGLGITSSVLQFSADRVDLITDIIKDAEPVATGTASDPSFIARLGVRFPAYVASTIMGTVAQTLQGVAAGLEKDLQYSQALREAELSNLQDLAELRAMASENEIAALEARLEELNLRNEWEIGNLEALIDALRRNLELDLAHQADLMELRDRRDAWRIQLVDAVRLGYELAQAELTVRQREQAYYGVVQRAQLLEGRFANMQMRWQNLDALLGSPDVLFSFANRMARAESRIAAARTALEEWLVALEYNAVRPFVAQRMAILLARNPSQLEAIANEFSRLQMVCGGPTTLETVDVSVRDDLLGMSFARTDDTGETVSPAARFRALLARAESGLQSDVIYTARESVKKRLQRGNVWAVDFDIDVEGFANLALTCNAKIDSVAVQLVGEGLGKALPVVSLVHHGTSQLRSCQPDISTYVQSLGPGTTAFGPVTTFRTAGRVVSPVAGLNQYGESLSWSRTLEGVPFAASYTLLVDREHPSNQAIDWSRLEDIRIQFRFTYQDVFPEGQCE